MDEVSLTEEMATFLIEERFKETEGMRLLQNGAELQLSRRLREAGISDHALFGVRHHIETLIEKKQSWRAWTPLPEAKKAVLRKEISQRIQIAELERILSQKRLFQVHIEENLVRFPNGESFPIRMRQKNRLVVGIPASKIMATQDYLNQEIVLQYLGDKNLPKMLFEGTWLPDGKVMIMDQHHRISAYQRKVSQEIPMIMDLDEKGEFFTQPHLYAKKFYTTWGLISTDDKIKLLEKLRNKSDAEIFQISQEL